MALQLAHQHPPIPDDSFNLKLANLGNMCSFKLKPSSGIGAADEPCGKRAALHMLLLSLDSLSPSWLCLMSRDVEVLRGVGLPSGVWGRVGCSRPESLCFRKTGHESLSSDMELIRLNICPSLLPELPGGFNRAQMLS
jgi:hypothetical protein